MEQYMKPAAIIIALALFTFLAAAAHAQDNCIPIRFARGTSTALVKGTVSSMDEGAPSHCYTLTTRGGQTATLTIKLDERIVRTVAISTSSLLAQLRLLSAFYDGVPLPSSSDAPHDGGWALAANCDLSRWL